MGLLEKMKTQRYSSSERSSSHSADDVSGQVNGNKALIPAVGMVQHRSRAFLLSLITGTHDALSLMDLVDNQSRLAVLCFNGIAVELRDLFRILEGLFHRAENRNLEAAHIYKFYDWFEGFYGILTCIYDAEEDILFSWLEKVGALKMGNTLAPKRRKKKKERARDLCWDMLELKMQFEKRSASGNSDSSGLVLEMRDEAEQLASRILMYIQTLVNELPKLLDDNFGFDERRMIEESVIGNFRASEPGKFVICAYARGIVDGDKREGFLEESFRTQKSTRMTVQKHTKRFKKRHTDLADDLAIKELVLEPQASSEMS